MNDARLGAVATMYFDEPFLTIHWDEDIQAVWAEWRDGAAGEPFRRGLDAGARLVAEKRARKWIADTKRLGVVPPPDVKWTNEDWFPRVISAGLRWMAFVMPRKVVAQMTVRMVVTKLDQHEVSTAYFETVEEARAWLQAQA